MNTELPFESKIYIAGHETRLGAGLCRRLRQLGFNQVLTRSPSDLDLCDQAKVNAFFESELPDYVFLAVPTQEDTRGHAGACADFLYTNLMSIANIVHASYLYEIKRLMNIAGTTSPLWDDVPGDEGSRGDHGEHGRALTLTRLAALELCDQYRRQFGCDFITVLFEHGTKEAAPSDVHPDDPALSALDEKYPAYPFTSSFSQRDLIYAHDPADACLFLMKHFSATRLIRIGTLDRKNVEAMTSP